MDIFCRDEKLNLSPYYLKPGLRVRRIVPAEGRPRAAVPRQGGRRRAAGDLRRSCRATGCRFEHALEQVLDTGKKRVGLLGFSFKAGTDDLRESPIVILAEALLGKGYAAAIYDQQRLARAAGRRQQGLHRAADPAPVVAALRHDRRSHRRVRRHRRRQRGAGVRGGASRDAGPDQTVIDLVRLPIDRTTVAAKYQGICW